MHKVTHTLFLLLIILTVSILTPKIAYASPGLTRPYYSKPTAHVITGGVSVTDPGNAYDLNNDTFAKFRYDPSTAGSFEVKSFNTTAGSPDQVIASVDFKLRYQADAGGTGEVYRIVYYVDTYGPVVLQDWTGAAATLDTYVWLNQSEPYDGIWNWTDISKIRLIVETQTGAGGPSYFYEYEAWVTISAYRKATIFVDPPSLTDPSSPFTVDINISDVDDLYGWEFKLYFNTTILSNGSVHEGPFLQSAGPTYFGVVNNTDNYNGTHGLIWLTCTLLGDIPGATGSGTLATIEFTVDGQAGTTTLDLTDTKLVGYEFWRKQLIYMEHNVIDGTVTITIVVPEFPFGLALEIALAVSVFYFIWKRRRKGPSKPTLRSDSLQMISLNPLRLR